MAALKRFWVSSDGPILDRAALEWRRALRENVPCGVDLAKARFVVERRRLRQARRGLQRAVDRRQRFVIQTVRVEALAFEPRQQIFDGLVVGHVVVVSGFSRTNAMYH